MSASVFVSIFLPAIIYFSFYIHTYPFYLLNITHIKYRNIFMKTLTHLPYIIGIVLYYHLTFTLLAVLWASAELLYGHHVTVLIY